jgi:hydroxymethylpyrimidine/phosphomethylpyrimidine kinase
MSTATALPPVVLTIAGSDSGGGAGLQADLKTFTVLGVYGASAVTAVTSQNTVGVSDFLVLPPDLVSRQIHDVVTDLGCAAAKTGMLGNADLVRAVAAAVRDLNISPLVVDPVMVSRSGAALLEDTAVAALIADLLPLAAVLTPNLPEAERLLGRAITGLDDMAQAAHDLAALGPKAVVLKGGHATGHATDVLFDAATGTVRFLHGPRLAAAHTHGTGCVFSSALTAWLARGAPLALAAARAKLFVTEAIRRGLALGHGHGPANVLAAGLFLPSS